MREVDNPIIWTGDEQRSVAIWEGLLLEVTGSSASGQYGWAVMNNRGFCGYTSIVLTDYNDYDDPLPDDMQQARAIAEAAARRIVAERNEK